MVFYLAPPKTSNSSEITISVRRTLLTLKELHLLYQRFLCSQDVRKWNVMKSKRKWNGSVFFFLCWSWTWLISAELHSAGWALSVRIQGVKVQTFTPWIIPSVSFCVVDCKPGRSDQDLWRNQLFVEQFLLHYIMLADVILLCCYILVVVTLCYAL